MLSYVVNCRLHPRQTPPGLISFSSSTFKLSNLSNCKRPLASSFQRPTSALAKHMSPNSFRITSLADPSVLTPAESYPYKKDQRAPLLPPRLRCSDVSVLHLCFQRLPGCFSRKALPFIILHCCGGVATTSPLRASKRGISGNVFPSDWGRTPSSRRREP